ncbi:MAG: recombinase family protein [Lachnospiraceae bacterium]
MSAESAAESAAVMETPGKNCSADRNQAGKVKVAAYCRVSTETDEQAVSLESQRLYFRKYIENQENWEFSGIYYDEGISGTQTIKRQGFNQMIEDALHHRIDLILTKEVSRFARNTVDTLSCTRRLKAEGIGVIFTIDNIDTRQPDGELRLTIMASLAQEESRKTSERVKWGQRRQMERGVVFGRDLLGYTVKNGKLKINEAEVPAVRAIFHKYTNEGKGIHVIARELLAEGMRPREASTWNPAVILRILRNEKYAGDLCQKKTITPDFLTHRKKYNHGEEELICIANHHEPIIDRDLWNRTQKELQKRSRSVKKGEKYSSRYWCSGKLYCGVCGKHFISRTKKCKNGKWYRAWRCGTAAGHGSLRQNVDDRRTACTNRSINEQSLLTCMEYCLSHILMDREEINEMILGEIRFMNTVGEETCGIQVITKQMEELKKRKKKLIDLAVSGAITNEEFQEQKAWYDQKNGLLMQQAQAAGDREKILLQTANMKSYEAELECITGLRKEMECTYPQQLYRTLLDHMVIYQDRSVEIYLKGLSCGFRLRISTCGRMEHYQTSIISMELINPGENGDDL